MRSAKLLNGGRAIDFKTGDFGVVLNLPREVIDPIDTIIVLELDGKPCALTTCGCRDARRVTGRHRMILAES